MSTLRMRMGLALGDAMPVSRVPAGGGGSARAFTLIEVLITLSLLVLLASMAWPALQTQITSSELPESAERVRSALAMARCEAVMEHRRFRVRFVKEEQQPKIECEADPINQPGVFTASTADWANEPMLLADVQVHDIQTGRPVYMQALSMTTDPDSARKQAEQAQLDKQEREQLRLGMGSGSEDAGGIDPLRPVITFEPDGSVDDWATFILARVRPEETLEEEQQQVWIVLDGRTGLAMVHPKVTMDQLSDPKFYVQREKLELPDRTGDLSFDVSDEAPADGGTADATGQTGVDSQGGENGALPQAVDGTGVGDSSGAQTIKEETENALNAGDAASQLENALDESSLTEDEKNNVRQAFPNKNQ
jgi:prepilin-type N-terminal cleavage/methylation domain-containing protein